MTRFITVKEEKSALTARFQLLDKEAPRHAEMLWRIAQQGGDHGAIHAMWTGPEISCPVVGDSLPQGAVLDLPPENATSFPDMGEIATVFAPKGTWKGAPDADFFDIGIFYGPGGRMLMPMGWIMGSVCARVVPEDLAALREGCGAIRRNGSCRLTFEATSRN
ncbi:MULTISPECIES: DUF3830 family protein [Komagataeibacter]|uniref:DUF3830 domain-containing protein n=1 Tax=Komagataeibacter saccharivorans TaxID=265959 RepID=A0A347WEB7_9PROT|nr:DUF3830 family protein [Komagataeibacter saccharivorans]AXY23210.1 hypothetical protein CD178_02463 [Komagataeibacter saccharivorans]MBL7238175.1 DUF3830 family protein [Novacetimonas hansenii]PMP98938.1 hypothetical protein S101450_00729 [Komagataeibacter saccharivorans]